MAIDKEEDDTDRGSHLLPLEIAPPQIKSLKDFAVEIKALAQEKRCSLIDAIVLYCEKTGLEIETAGALIKSSSKMKAEIREEFEELNFLPKTSKLPGVDNER
jgi:hypothetical protein